MRTREYMETIEVTKDDCYKMKKALFYLKQKGIEEQDLDKLDKLLADLSLGGTLLTLLFNLPTVVGVISSVATVLEIMTPSYKETMEECIQDGHDGLEAVEYWFDENTDVSKIKLKAFYYELYGPFNSFKFIQMTGVDYIQEKYVDGKWCEV